MPKHTGIPNFRIKRHFKRLKSSRRTGDGPRPAGGFRRKWCGFLGEAAKSRYFFPTFKIRGSEQQDRRERIFIRTGPDAIFREWKQNEDPPENPAGSQAAEKVRWTFSTAFTMPRFSARTAGRKAAAARRKRLLTQAFCRHSIQHEGAPGHRCGFAIPGPFWAANRAASSKPARFFRRWRRFASFPFVLPLQKRTLFLQTGFFDKLRTGQNIRRVLGKYMGSAAARRAVGRLFRAGMEPISKRWSWRRRTAGTGRRRQCWRGCTGRRRCGHTPPRSDSASGGSWRCPAWCTPPR